MKLKELWKDIEGYKDYQISSHGRVKSMERSVRCRGVGLKTVKEKILKAQLNGRKPRQYYAVSLYESGNMKTIRVHVLVGKYFVDNPDNLPILNHLDNNPLNNYYKNLEWSTIRDNLNHGHTFRKTSSDHAGVCKRGKKWEATIYTNGTRKYLGSFTSELKAAHSYQNALKLIL